MKVNDQSNIDVHISAGATTTTTKEPSATEASAAPIQPPPEVKMLMGKVDDGMFKMKVGGVMLVNGFIMIIACIIVFFCSIKPKLEAENGGRSMQYNVVTMSGHDDSKAWTLLDWLWLFRLTSLSTLRVSLWTCLRSRLEKLEFEVSHFTNI